MNEEEIKNLLFSDPVNFFKSLEEKGEIFEDLKELDIPRLFVKEKFPELVKEKDFQAAESFFWISYYVEREIGDIIFSMEILLGKKPDDVEAMVDEMTFGRKIIFIRDHYIESKSDELISVLGTIRTLRNHLAHGRLHKLVYKNFPLSDPRTYVMLFVDFMNALKGAKDSHQAEKRIF